MQLSIDSYDSTLARIYELLRSLGISGMNYDCISESARLIEDVGLNSLKLIDLTVQIEDAFGIPEFPMQDWVDEQQAAGNPLTAGELAKACHALRQSVIASAVR